MTISDLCIKHKAAVTILVILVFVLGVLSWVSMRKELIPNIEIPTIFLVVPYEGASAKEVNDKITKILEKEFATMADLKNIKATNISGASIILLEFGDSIDVYAKILDVREVVNQAKGKLPENVGEPTLAIGGATDLPIFSFVISGNIDFEELIKIGKDEIIPEISHFEGVSEVDLVGEQDKNIYINVRVDDLAINGISIFEVYGAIATKNVSIPAGKVIFQKKKINLKSVSESTNLEEIRNIIVGVKNGVPIYLRNVADVALDLSKRDIEVTVDGEDAIVVNVKRRKDGNALNIIQNSKAYLEELSKKYNNKISFQVLEDDSKMVDNSIESIIKSAILGIILAVVVILLFLKDVKSTLIIATSIPISIVGGFIGMKVLGLSINFLSLCGITISLGMVVDNSIVALESIYAHKSDDVPVDQYVSKGMKIVGGPIIASTTTTVSVLIPLLFLQGLAGKFFYDIAITLAFAISVSAISSLTVVPAMCSKFMNLKIKIFIPEFLKKISDAVFKKIDIFLIKTEDFYKFLLLKTLNNFLYVIVLSFFILVITALLITMMGVLFLPPTDYSVVKLEMSIPASYNPEQAKQKVAEVEKVIQDELKSELDRRVVFLDLGNSTKSAFFMADKEIVGTFFLSPVNKRKRSSYQIVDALNTRIQKEVTDCEVDFYNGGFDYLIRYITGGDKIYKVSIEGEDLDVMNKTAIFIENILEQDPQIYKTNKSMDLGQKELVVRLDPDRMGTLGIDARQAAITSRLIFNKADVGIFNDNGEIYDMVLKSDLSDKSVSQEVLENIYVKNMFQQFAALATFSDIELESVPKQIDRNNKKNFIDVIGFSDSYDLTAIKNRMDKKLKEINLPTGIEWKVSGASKMVADMLKDVLLVLLFSIFLVYSVMVIQFNRYLHPLLILASIPFCLIGVILGLIIFGSQISMIAFLGIIALSGIVVNNAIVLVDYINYLRFENNYSLRHAILRAGQVRLRPILMTTLTTMVGILPLAFASGNGSEVYAPLGQAIFGGLFSSTVITLFIVPLLYYKLENHFEKKEKPNDKV